MSASSAASGAAKHKRGSAELRGMRAALMLAVLGTCVMCVIGGVLLLAREWLLLGLLGVVLGFSVAFGLAVFFDQSGRRAMGSGREDRPRWPI